jgi:hypothetical protein
MGEKFLNCGFVAYVNAVMGVAGNFSFKGRDLPGCRRIRAKKICSHVIVHSYHIKTPIREEAGRLRAN